VAWSKRPWTIPLLLRLYRGKKEAGSDYRTKSQLAREMFDLFLQWLPAEQRVRLLVDSGYMGKTMLRGLPLDRVTVFGALRTNAALHLSPTKSSKRRGRHSKRGLRLQTPSQMHRERVYSWKTVPIRKGAKVHQKEALSLKAQWYSVLGERLNHVVLVRDDDEKLRVILCTDPTLDAAQIVEQGARRWSIEVFNHDVKQFFGFADSPAWSEQSVLRTAPWVALLSGILVVWFHRVYQRTQNIPVPQRPWYDWKEDLSFADVVRYAQLSLGRVDVLPWARSLVPISPKVFALNERRIANISFADANANCIEIHEKSAA
jgi:hypothetical protein